MHSSCSRSLPLSSTLLARYSRFMELAFCSPACSDDSKVREEAATFRVNQLTNDRKQAILFRGGRGWAPQEKVQNERERGERLDCVDYLGVHLPAGAHTAARNLISSHASFYKVSCFSLPGQDKTVTRRAAYFPGDTASAKVSYVHALLALATAGLPYLQYATLEQVEQL